MTINPIRTVLTVALATLTSGFCITAQANSLQLNQAQWQAMGLQTAATEAVNSVPSIQFQAEAIMPLNLVQNFTSPLSGKIVKLNKIHGEVVKGEVIALMESADLAMMQSELLGVLAQLDVAYKGLKRTKQLNASGVASTKQLQEAQAAVSALQAQKVQGTEALKVIGMPQTEIDKLLASRKVQVTQLAITSSIDGLLFDMSVRSGQGVDQNQKLFGIGPLDPMMVNISVPVEFANQLTEGTVMTIEGSDLQGEVHHIETMVDPLTQKVEVHALVENGGVKIRPGQSLQVRFLMSQGTAFRAPRNAVAQLDGEAVVFVAKDQNQVEVLPIKIQQIDKYYLYFSSQAPAGMVISKGTTAVKLAFSAESEE